MRCEGGFSGVRDVLIHSVDDVSCVPSVVCSYLDLMAFLLSCCRRMSFNLYMFVYFVYLSIYLSFMVPLQYYRIQI